MLWKGFFRKKTGLSQDRFDADPDGDPDPPSDAPILLLIAALVISIWGIILGSRTFQAWKLSLEAGALGLVLVILVRACAGARLKTRFARGAPLVLASIAVVLITITAAFDTNCSFPSGEARNEQLPILAKRCTYKKGRRHACLLTVLADDHTESINVMDSEWDRAQVGGAYTTTVWTGYWGFRYISSPGDR